ncbi:MAG: class I SAM-dependent methyltransferase [Chloroflexi bacterium]|nr:class I SAM-dependent methyltransferase [Chloroflexota bacterium]MCY3582028.1 class I SAM-dependent methyltransferase [Chloroflexota bacterium]MCY3717456.1 class I SAM-dependent methyltransferase [Chloroflexota bacterium]MDE2652093.1 class I SAM-dependent methyltransferase [Chloroflexota bacterium]MXV92169.1 class I SAM-dependent methyltransferase [Chloroflexota bacterium]
MAIRSDTAGKEKGYLQDMLAGDAGCVLEIGCGDGRLTRKVHDRAQGVVGIDLPEALQPAAFADLPNARCLAASATALPFRAACFNGAIFALSF